MTKKQTRTLAIHLIKQSAAGPENIIREGHRGSGIELRLGDTPAMLFIGTRPLKPPKWSKAFEGLIDIDRFGKTMTPGAVLLTEAADRTFAITFGTGRHMLEPECWEERFGLLVVLNSIKGNAIKSIDKKTIDSISRQTREQASRDVGARDFGLDIERDLLRAVTGTPEDNTLGQSLYGMDALKATVKADLIDLPHLLPKYYDRFQDKAYRENFPWIDQLSEVKQKSLKAKLDERLLKLVADQSFERCWLAAPDIIDWDVVAGFRYGQSRKTELFADLNFQDFLAYLGPNTAVDHAAFGRRVCCYDANDTVIYEWPAYACINCELDDETDGAFLLSSGKWYRISKSFVKDVNEFVSGVERYDFAFPIYNHNTETEYNAHVAAAHNDRFILQDRRNITHGGGKSKIEFCDLYDRQGALVHVKRYGGSSVLSHLFAQGVLSGELFKSDASFQRKALTQIGLDADIAPNAHTIVFAVISNSEGERLELPFFSRLNLKHSVRRLRSYGYKVKIAKIRTGGRGRGTQSAVSKMLESV